MKTRNKPAIVGLALSLTVVATLAWWWPAHWMIPRSKRIRSITVGHVALPSVSPNPKESPC